MKANNTKTSPIIQTDWKALHTIFGGSEPALNQDLTQAAINQLSAIFSNTEKEEITKPAINQR